MADRTRSESPRLARPLTAHHTSGDGTAPGTPGLVAATLLAVLPLAAVTAPLATAGALAVAAGALAARRSDVDVSLRGLGSEAPTRLCLEDRCLRVGGA